MTLSRSHIRGISAKLQEKNTGKKTPQNTESTIIRSGAARVARKKLKKEAMKGFKTHRQSPLSITPVSMETRKSGCAAFGALLAGFFHPENKNNQSDNWESHHRQEVETHVKGDIWF